MIHNSLELAALAVSIAAGTAYAGEDDRMKSQSWRAPQVTRSVTLAALPDDTGLVSHYITGKML